MNYRWLFPLLLGTALGTLFNGRSSDRAEMTISWDPGSEEDELVVTLWEENDKGNARLLDHWVGKDITIATPDGDIQLSDGPIHVIIPAPKETE